ncbi:MerR family transcriptional regulator [Levilactobacillus namurensis]|uniref:MerR family transcriptional regulator n=1 Tax=Levilactobacillus namurensis TaxID=380393 RepID=UPI0009DEC41C|nr:MerR family transcriptional regulator [Levilactobacillus namurensis]
MTYSITQLAALAGLSTRTLRYYDQIGLLRAQRNPTNDYRTYTAAQVDQLQQIRYWQAFGFTLAEIRHLLAQSPAQQDALLRQQRGASGRRANPPHTLAEQSRPHLSGPPRRNSHDRFRKVCRFQAATSYRQSAGLR